MASDRNTAEVTIPLDLFTAFVACETTLRIMATTELGGLAEQEATAALERFDAAWKALTDEVLA